MIAHPAPQMPSWALLLLVLAGAARAQDAVADDADPATRPWRVASDLRYAELERDPRRNRLDLYRPVGDDHAPVVVFVHGGSWVGGSKERYPGVGRFLAANGFAAAVVNYGLHPFARWPAPARDVAAACAWLRREQRQLGIDGDRLVLCGHSAGGQIAAMVAFDRRWLDDAGAADLRPRAFVGLSGVYDLRPRHRLLCGVFGTDLAARADASPIVHVEAAAPPTRLFWAERDLDGLPLSARMLAARLRSVGVAVDVDGALVAGSSHAGYVRGIDVSYAAFGEQLLRFLRARTGDEPNGASRSATDGDDAAVRRAIRTDDGTDVTVLLPSPGAAGKAPVLVFAADPADVDRLHGAAASWAARGLAIALVPCPSDPATRAAGLGAVLATCAHFAAHAAELGVDPQRLFLGGIGRAAVLSLAAAQDPRAATAGGIVTIAARYPVDDDAAARPQRPLLQLAGSTEDPATAALDAAGAYTIPIAALDDDGWIAAVGADGDPITALLLGFVGL